MRLFLALQEELEEREEGRVGFGGEFVLGEEDFGPGLGGEYAVAKELETGVGPADIAEEDDRHLYVEEKALLG